MLQSIVPPMVGATDLKSPPGRTADKDFKGSGAGTSFGKALEEKISSKSPKEAKESPPKEMRGKDEKPGRSSTEEKREPEVAKTDGKAERKGAVRQQKIKEFMDSFESEFEISPTRLVEAMTQLNDTQLAQSPEETAEAVIAQLDLSDEDAGKAQAMYAALLLQLKQAQQPMKTPEFTVGTGVTTQGMQVRVDQAQTKQDVLSATVDRLNQKFWSQPEGRPLPTATANLEAGSLQKMMIDEASFETPIQESTPREMSQAPAQAPAQALKELPPHLQGQMKETMSPSLLAALAAQKAAEAQSKNELSGVEKTPSEQGADLMAEFNRALESTEAPKVMPESMRVSREFMQNQSQGQSLMEQSSQFLQQGAKEGKELMAEESAVKSVDFEHSLQGVEGLHGAPIKGESLKLDALVPAAAPQGTASPSENEAAVKQLMNQAQYLIKKGGGEMKVQMTPEGMGTIHLKVMLQDGKVNLQMAAETPEAKKTIESSLAELKTSLAGHKLSMENVKVDVVNSTSADTAMQNQTNTNGQQRDQTRQFWNQFNENFGSQGRRESFAEMPSLKGYGSRGRDPLQPIETRSVTRKVEGKGSGLNLVA